MLCRVLCQKMKKIYFAARLTGASAEDRALYRRLILLLRNYGEVLSEAFGNEGEIDEVGTTDQQIHDNDMVLVTSADVVVAEVTQASLGVGYEIGRAREMEKRILCVFRPERCSRLSPMIAGAHNGTSFIVRAYATDQEAAGIFNEFFAA